MTPQSAFQMAPVTQLVASALMDRTSLAHYLGRRQGAKGFEELMALIEIPNAYTSDTAGDLLAADHDAEANPACSVIFVAVNPRRSRWVSRLCRRAGRA